MTEERKAEIELEFYKKELIDKNAKRDAKRRMAWACLASLLSYPIILIITSYLSVDILNVLKDISGTYFIAITGIISAFFGFDVYEGKK